MPTIRSEHLRFTGGNSDKIYNIYLDDRGTVDRYVVRVEYGRYGGVPKELDKGSYTTESHAVAVFNNLCSEKLSKGYTRSVVQTIKTAKKPKTNKKAVQLRQNIEEGVRRIEFEL